jgi:hypothetical protein
LKCASWAIQFSFLRVTPSQDISIFNHLYNSSGDHALQYFCLGARDIVEILWNQAIEPDVKHYTTSNILKTSILSAFLPNESITGQDFINWLKESPTILVVLLKVNPRLLTVVNLDGIDYCIKYLNSQFPEEEYKVVFTLSNSEFILIFKNTGFDVILDKLLKFLKKTTVEDVFGTNNLPARYPNLENEPVFINVRTFPLISYQEVILHEKYGRLTGYISPNMLVRCYPNHVDNVINFFSSEQFISRVFWGNYDVSITGNNILLKDFIPKLVQFRKEVKVCATYSFVLGEHKSNEKFLAEANLISESKTRFAPLEHVKATNKLIQGFIKEVDFSKVDTSLRSDLLNFLNRLHDLISDPIVSTDYVDLAEFLKYLQAQVVTLIKTEPSETRAFLQEACYNAIVLASHVLYNRSSGLEEHLHVPAYGTLSSTIGLTQVINAMEEVPRYVIDHHFTQKRKIPNLNQKWFGFVVYGLGYEFSLCPGEVITYPTRSLFNPFKNWTIITHELSHVYSQIANIKEQLEKLLDKKEYSEKNQIARQDHSIGSTTVFREELFAYWFDFVYFYRRDLDLYCKVMWSNWLENGIVWRKSIEYLVKSFLIYSAKKKFRKPLSIHQLDDMFLVIAKTCPNFKKFQETISVDTKQNVVRITEEWAFIIDVFEHNFLDEILYKNMGKKYKTLMPQVEAISNGFTISERIENPLVLYFELLKLLVDFEPVNNTAAITAFSLSFANDNRRQMWDGLYS